MTDLDPDQRAALDRIVSGPIAWSPEPPDGAGVLQVLQTLGWVERWPEAEAWTLTPLGANRLGVALVEEGPAEAPRWAPEREAARRQVKLPRHPREVELPYPERVEAPEPEGDFVRWERDGVLLEPIELFGRPVPIDQRLRRVKR